MTSSTESDTNRDVSVVYITTDLMFSSRAAHAAGRAGLDLRVVADLPSALRACAANRVALALIDLATPGIDPATCVEELRGHTNRPAKIIAYGPHVHEAKLSAAVKAGCDQVMSRGQFHASLEQLVKNQSNTE